jgi:hypothetical protein
MRHPREAAQAWFAKAEKERDDYDRFVALWIAFNALYSEFLETSERQAIGKFICRTVSGPDDGTIKHIVERTDAQFFRDRIIRDVRRGARDTMEHATILGARYRTPRHRLKALLMILYQVRCNLFHGDKTYGRDSDNEVVANAAKALMQVLRAYLNQPSATIPRAARV